MPVSVSVRDGAVQEKKHVTAFARQHPDAWLEKRLHYGKDGFLVKSKKARIIRAAKGINVREERARKLYWQ